MDNNNLACLYPELAKEWHPLKNMGLFPTMFSVGSHQVVWWLGKCGHQWDAAIKDRVRGNGCPICAGKKIVSGINDLASQRPLIAKEWSYEDNGNLLPTMFAVTSHKKVVWKCSYGHTYTASIDGRVRGRGCPFCAHKLVDKGKNDLATMNATLAQEWSEKNYPLKPDSVFAFSHKVVLWRCSLCRNEWSASIYSRQAGNGCPMCARKFQSSFPEQAVFFYVKRAYPDAINGYQDIFDNAMELDVYIPSLSIGIEYDGVYWHMESKTKKNEKKKYEVCRTYGVCLIRIREKNKKGKWLFSSDCDFQIEAEDNLNKTILSLTEYLPNIDDVDVNRDKSVILEQYYHGIYKNSLEAQYPEIAKEWHPEKNKGLLPNMFSAKTDKKVWWLCPIGHSYECTIAHRTGMGSNCPYCSNRRILIGLNDFRTKNVNQILFDEWDIEKNNEQGITMTGICEGSHRKVFWICPKGHSYQMTIYERKKSSGCPVCAGRTILFGFNDLETRKPEIAKEWHPTKNSGLLPSQFLENSNKYAWWLCQTCGQSWHAMIVHRSRGSGCPYCSGRYAIPGKTDLLTVNPTLAEEWHPTKNKELMPYEVKPGSDIKIWWKCKKCSNEWQATVKSRSGGRGCPNCNKYYAKQEYDSKGCE